MQACLYHLSAPARVKFDLTMQVGNCRYAIAKLFDVARSVVTKHLKNIFESEELSKESSCAHFAQVADNGKTKPAKQAFANIHREYKL